MDYSNYITALTKIDGYIWEVIGAMKADILYNDTTMGEQAEGSDMKRLHYGQGSITQKQRKRPNGTLYRWYEGKIYRNGKVNYVTGKTKELCYERLRELDKTLPEYVETPTITFGEWVEKWLEIYKTNIKPKTKQDYRQTVARYLQGIVDRPINTLKAMELQAILNDVAKELPRRARTIYDLFHSSLTEAWNNDYLEKDVTKALKRPVVEESKEETPLTAEQQLALTTLPDKQMAQIFTAYLWSGCRLNELLTLRPEFWNKAESTLFIDGTKTKTSKRVIPVFPPLQAVFEQLPMNGEFIFRISEKTLKRRKANVEKQVGFHFTYKALRHTFNQNLTEWGIEDITRAAWMGHSKPTTTKRTYTHLTKSLQDKGVKMVLDHLTKWANDTT